MLKFKTYNYFYGNSVQELSLPLLVRTWLIVPSLFPLPPLVEYRIEKEECGWKQK
jgi:hypothetical protein